MVVTLKAYEILTAAKLPAEQAKAIPEVVKTSQESWLQNLAGKNEWEEGLAALKEEIAALRTEVKEESAGLPSAHKEEIGGLRSDMQGLSTEIYRVKFDLRKWLIPLLGQGAFVVALLKILKQHCFSPRKHPRLSPPPPKIKFFSPLLACKQLSPQGDFQENNSYQPAYGAAGTS